MLHIAKPRRRFRELQFLAEYQPYMFCIVPSLLTCLVVWCLGCYSCGWTLTFQDCCLSVSPVSNVSLVEFLRPTTGTYFWAHICLSLLVSNQKTHTVPKLANNNKNFGLVRHWLSSTDTLARSLGLCLPARTLSAWFFILCWLSPGGISDFITVVSAEPG
jgi:hypothetical protein